MLGCTHMCLQNYFTCNNHAGQDAQVAQESQVLSGTPIEHYLVYLGNLMLYPCYVQSCTELHTKVQQDVRGS